ncbi:hypothetical protein CPB86DRAFT_775988 [Serendipita vermifera]|nr:hypothetical protein CPB86DRAFT_775988 [Serendipita vermifera]
MDRYGRSSPPDHGRVQPPAQSTPNGPTGPYVGSGFPARPFLCEDCGMNFARTHDLKRHQTTHVPGVKKTHPCPYCGKNLSRRDAIKRHVVSKQCPVATEKGYGWPPPEGHVPPLPDTTIERTTHRRGENPYPILGSASTTPTSATGGNERVVSAGYTNGTTHSNYPVSPTSNGPYGANGYPTTAPTYAHGNPGAYAEPAMAHNPPGVVFEYDHRSSHYKSR